MDHIEMDDFVSIQLNKKKKTPLYVQLYDQLVYLIQSGKLAPGRPLPPVRKLAEHLTVNPGTAVSAYRELEQNGYILTRRGSGSFVSDTAGPLAPAVSTALTEEPAAPGMTDMNRIAMEPELFSMDTLQEIISRVIRRDGPYAFSYSESQGWRPLRESIATSLEKEGIRTDPDLIQIVSGSQQGVDIAARTLLRHGDFVLTETPTYPGAAASFRACGARITGIPLTEAGVDMDKLEAAADRFHPRLLYLMPDIQNPTGLSYSPAVKGRLMGLTSRSNFYILEDDYLGGLSYSPDRKPLKALDKNDRVIYLRSVSSLFIPGFRLAYLVMPEALVPLLKKTKYIADIATSGLTQRVFDLYLREKLWDAHIASLRRGYRDRLDFAYKTARRVLPPDVSILRPAGGLSLWITLPSRLSAKEILQKAAEKGYLFCSGDPFFLREAPDRHIRVSFASASLPAMEEGLTLLGTLCGKS